MAQMNSSPGGLARNSGQIINAHRASGLFFWICGPALLALCAVYAVTTGSSRLSRTQGGPYLSAAMLAGAIGRFRERLIVFARYPVPGETKTRLIEHLGAERAASLQDAMTRHTLAQVSGTAKTRGIEAEIRFIGGEGSLMAKKYGNEWRYTPQGDGDLGQRLRSAVQEAFAAGAAKVVVIGTDCPAITPACIASAFDALGGNDLVVGPAVDGGFYLLGLRQRRPELFEGIAWGTAAVLDQMLAVARSLGLAVRLLTPLQDVDRPEDLPVWERVSGNRSKSAHTVETQESH